MTEQPVTKIAQERPPAGDGIFQGQRIGPEEFTTSMTAFYRAQVERVGTARERMDITTNWAVATTAGAISITFGSTGISHGLILLDGLLVTAFMIMETHRYRYYRLWDYRARLMETEFFAPMLAPPYQVPGDWADALRQNLLKPRYPISFWRAMGKRLIRTYFWIYTVIVLSWLLKLALHPQPAVDISDLSARAAIATIPGNIVLVLNLLFYGFFAINFVIHLLIRDAEREDHPVKPDLSE